MSLGSVVPWGRLREVVGGPLVREEYGLPEIASILKVKGEGVHGVGAYVWHRAVMAGAVSPPNKLAGQFERHDPRLYKSVSRELRQEAIKDVYLGKAWLEQKKKSALVAEVFLATVWPGELHLADVNFQNPNEPLPYVDRKPYQTHRGFGALGELIEGMRAYGKAEGLGGLSLMAATRSLVTVFERHGFKVEDSEVGRMALRMGVSVPMRIDL